MFVEEFDINLAKTLSFQQRLAESMKAQSVFFHVNIKAIFCLALVTALTNLVFTQNLYTSPLDDTRNALMSFSSGVSSPKPTAPPPVSKDKYFVILATMGPKLSIGGGGFGGEF